MGNDKKGPGLYCQKCRTPIDVDASVDQLNPAAFKLLTGMMPDLSHCSGTASHTDTAKTQPSKLSSKRPAAPLLARPAQHTPPLGIRHTTRRYSRHATLLSSEMYRPGCSMAARTPPCLLSTCTCPSRCWMRPRRQRQSAVQTSKLQPTQHRRTQPTPRDELVPRVAQGL
jgi:hypothetical protein